MLKHTVYHAGYTGRPLEELLAFVREHPTGTVVDVRLKPFSRNPSYSRVNLSKRFGTAYHHLDALGNLNYKGGPMILANPDLGFDQIRALLETGPVLVLCVCADPSICHRRLIIDRLKHEGYVVADWSPVPPQRDRTASLF